MVFTVNMQKDCRRLPNIKRIFLLLIQKRYWRNGFKSITEYMPIHFSGNLHVQYSRNVLKLYADAPSC